MRHAGEEMAAGWSSEAGWGVGAGAFSAGD